jgi:ribosomal protein L29
MAKANYKTLSNKELTDKLVELKGSYFNLRFSHRAGQLGSPMELPKTRKEIARVMTEINARNIQAEISGKEKEIIDTGSLSVPAAKRTKVAVKKDKKVEAKKEVKAETKKVEKKVEAKAEVKKEVKPAAKKTESKPATKTTTKKEAK